MQRAAEGDAVNLATVALIPAGNDESSTKERKEKVSFEGPNNVTLLGKRNSARAQGGKKAFRTITRPFGCTHPLYPHHLDR